MRSFITTAAFALGASAAALHPRSSTCCFGITVSGSTAGSLGQLDDGQNRVGPGFGGSSYCISGTTITDSTGKGCVIAEPSTQFQCDLNSPGTPGFSITSGGLIAFGNSTTFYECAATDTQFNVYTTPAGTRCSKVTLSTTGGSCAPKVASSSSIAPYVNTTIAPSTSRTIYTIPTTSSVVVAPTVTIISSVAGATFISTVTTPAPAVTIISSVPGATFISTVTTPAPAVTIYSTVSAAAQSAELETLTEVGPTVTAAASTCAPTTIFSTVEVPTTIYKSLTVTQFSTSTSVQYVTVTAPASTVTEHTTEYKTAISVQHATVVESATEYKTATQTETQVKSIAGPTETETVAGPTQTTTQLQATTQVESITQTATQLETTTQLESITVAGPTQTTTQVQATTQVESTTETVAGPTQTETQLETTTQVESVTLPATTVISATTEVETQVQSTTQVESVTLPGETIIASTTATIVSTTSVTTTAVVSVSSSAATSAAASTISSSSTACVASLVAGAYQTPHLIIPVNSSAPTTAYGTQYNGDVSSTVSSIFNFDIPASYQGETCSLIFLLPLKSELETSDYTTTGTGGIEVLQLSSAVTVDTTYNTVPSVESTLGTFDISVGSSTVIATTACAAGETVTYELKATGSYALNWFEDWNPSPLGLFISSC